MPQMTTQVKQKTRMGFMFDTMRIPIPILRPMAIPQPAEMTMTMPVAPAAGMMPMMPMMPMAAPMMPMAAAPMGMPMTPPVGMAQMNVQGQMSLQQLLMMLAAQGQVSPQVLQALSMQLGAGGGGAGGASQLLAQL